MPSFPYLEQPLTDGTVVLRDAAERDIPEILIAHEDDPQLYVRLGMDRPPSGAQLGRRAEDEPSTRAAGEHATFAILEPGSDVCRGQINVHKVNWEHGRAELGVWLAPQARGQGMGAGALRLASAWLMAECGLERLEIVTESDNAPMIRAAETAGYVFEGVLRGYTKEHGKRVDNAILSLVKSDLER